MLLDAYQRELAHLREAGCAFGERHPSIAGALARGGDDPDLERLLQGFAFVSAQLRQRIDHAAPELVEGITELLFPHVLRPTPASTIVQFQPAPRSLRGRRRIPHGARLLSRAVGTHRCTFTTTRPLDVLPLRLAETLLDDGSDAHPELTLRFELESGSEAAVFTREGVRLHLHGEPGITAQLYLWLARHLVGVSVRVPGQRPIELGAGAARPVGFDDDDTLLPWPACVSHGIRLVQEYFVLPAKFRFVDLVELDRVAHQGTDRFDVVLRFERPPRLPSRPPADWVRLHCVPAVNLFDAGAEPVRVDPGERPTLLRVAGLTPAHADVFSVESVIGMTRHGERAIYRPPLTCAPAVEPPPGHYRLHRRSARDDDGVDTSIALQRDAGNARARGDETLSIELRCTNRTLTRALQIGDIATPTTDTGAGLTFTNIAPVTPPAHPPLGDALLWHFIAHLGCSRRSLSDPDALRRLLALYITSERDHAVGRQQRAHVDAIGHVRCATITRVVAGIATRGSHYEIELARSGFASQGEAFAFATVLQRLLALDARLNSFADLTVQLAPTGETWHFEAELLP